MPQIAQQVDTLPLWLGWVQQGLGSCPGTVLMYGCAQSQLPAAQQLGLSAALRRLQQARRGAEPEGKEHRAVTRHCHLPPRALCSTAAADRGATARGRVSSLIPEPAWVKATLIAQPPTRLYPGHDLVCCQPQQLDKGRDGLLRIALSVFICQIYQRVFIARRIAARRPG